MKLEPLRMGLMSYKRAPMELSTELLPCMHTTGSFQPRKGPSPDLDLSLQKRDK